MLKYKNYVNETLGKFVNEQNKQPLPLLNKGDDVKYIGALANHRNNRWTIVKVDDFSPPYRQYTIRRWNPSGGIEPIFTIEVSRKDIEKIEKTKDIKKDDNNKPIFGRGDEVYFIPTKNRKIYDYLSGETGIVSDYYPNYFYIDGKPYDAYEVKFKNNNTIFAYTDELKKTSIPKENKITKNDPLFKEGDKVIFSSVNGRYPRIPSESNGEVMGFRKDFYTNYQQGGASIDAYEVRLKDGGGIVMAFERELKKNTQEIEVGDTVIFKPALGHWQYDTYGESVGKECVVEHSFDDGDFRLRTPSGMKIITNKTFFTKVNKEKEKVLKIGSKVRCVKSPPGFNRYLNKEGIVVEINTKSIKVEGLLEPNHAVYLFDGEYEIIEDPIDEKKKKELKKGDKIICKKPGDAHQNFYGKEGIVSDVYLQGIGATGIMDSDPKHSIYLKKGEYEVVDISEEKIVKFGTQIVCTKKGEFFNKKSKVVRVFGSGVIEVIFQMGGHQQQIYLSKNDYDVIDENEHTLEKGDKVIVDGKEGRFVFGNRTGTVERIDDDTIFVNFDEDDSKNMRSFTMSVNKKIVKYAGENKGQKEFEKGDKVICIKNTSEWFNKKGKISNVISKDKYSVIFEGGLGVSYISHLNKEDIKLAEEDFTSKQSPIKNSNEEEEEEEDEETSTTKTTKMSKEDILNYPYVDFFADVVEKNEIVEKVTKYEEILKNEGVTKFKKNFYEKSLKTAELIIQYFDFLTAKIAKGKKVVRAMDEVIPELMELSTKIRASESKDLTKKYSFDSGIIIYWEFEDGVVFKTL